MTAVTSGAENQKARQGRTETDTDSGTRRFSPFPSVTDALRSLRKFPAEAQNAWIKAIARIRNNYGAVLLLNVLKRGNAVATINSSFNSVTRDSRIQILLVAWLPYAALAVILLISRMPALPIKKLIAAAPGLCLPELFHAPGTAVKWNLIGNPALMPFCVISAVTAFCWKIPAKEFGGLVKNTAKQISGAAIAIAASVALVSVMVISRYNGAELPGMPDAVATALSRLMGKYFLIGSPFIGALGSFFAGSCTVSDILFVQLQFDTGSMLDLPEYITVALQNIGGGLGSMLRLSGVIATCATVNLTGKEGKIILLNTIPLVIFCIFALFATAVLWNYLV